ncbi:MULTISPECIES: competence/damage-inducible protein A [unclassified Gemella]|uniref:competence/damage-inducible protein A n=1 Tax=unclassified Gemella TaxID=2624949 RepID=UPI0015D07CA3|nr:MULTISPECIES: competence/damage-inducible protein A [unclassified Gemella]MBF0709775.1 competence/damage-inducible protein A [Gemella sp. GL1.1]NYS27119.1 competence/damage-inducible protein A [Gemella sp. GL1]
MRVELISVGTEILIGDILNTNVHYLSKELANLGINVFRHTSVGDNRERFLKVLSNAFKDADTVIVTGGLGPTDDDITKECVAKFFKRKQYLDKYYWNKIQNYLLNHSSNKTITKNDEKTASIPEGAITFENFWGTAPAIAIEDYNRKIILLPGPPHEMKNIFNHHIRDYLASFSNQKFLSKYIRFFGIGESLLEDRIKDLMIQQTNPSLALYAKYGEVLLRITASASSAEECEKLIDNKIKEVYELVGEYIYLVAGEEASESQSEMNKVLAKLLIDNNISISTAESITGGLIVSTLIENEGISSVLKESYISYSDQSKIDLLGVNIASLKNYTAVSKEVAEEMLDGLILKTNVESALITTGYANHEKKYLSGLVYIGAYYKGEKIIKKFHYSGNRNKIRYRASQEAMNVLRKLILSKIS